MAYMLVNFSESQPTFGECVGRLPGSGLWLWCWRLRDAERKGAASGEEDRG